MSDGGFSPRTVLGMLLVGLLGFVGLLYALGSGSGGGEANNGGTHAGGKGLNGFAALYALLQAEGHPVRQVRSEGELEKPGLLVLTPPPSVDGKELAAITEKRRYVGPTLIIAPKWLAMPSDSNKAAKGWTKLAGVVPVQWPGFHDEIGVSATGEKDNKPAGGWVAARRRGPLPDDRVVLSGAGDKLVSLVESGDGRILAAWIDEGEYYPALERFTGREAVEGDSGNGTYPLVLVFEPDLLDNWGLADERTAALAVDLVAAVQGGETGEPIRFDLTQNGFGGGQNLLTLAFRPPFLAATICLLLAGLALAWRGFNRFGPPRRKERAIALGKGALVENSAGLIRRTGRVHLVAGPYADGARERIATALGLARGLDAARTEAAIDRAQERRGIGGPLFSKAAASLRGAHKPHEVARRAAVLQTIERGLT